MSRSKFCILFRAILQTKNWKEFGFFCSDVFLSEATIFSQNNKDLFGWGVWVTDSVGRVSEHEKRKEGTYRLHKFVDRLYTIPHCYENTSSKAVKWVMKRDNETKKDTRRHWNAVGWWSRTSRDSGLISKVSPGTRRYARFERKLHVKRGSRRGEMCTEHWYEPSSDGSTFSISRDPFETIKLKNLEMF